MCGGDEREKGKKSRERGYSLFVYRFFFHVYMCTYMHRGVKGEREGMKRTAGGMMGWRVGEVR